MSVGRPLGLHHFSLQPYVCHIVMVSACKHGVLLLTLLYRDSYTTLVYRTRLVTQQLKTIDNKHALRISK